MHGAQLEEIDLHDKKEMKFSIYPRLHMTLISMHNKNYRYNGGIGFTISNPCHNIIFTPSKTTNISKPDFPELHFLKEQIEEIKNKLKFKDSINFTITDEIPAHHGFGTGTALRLACLEALFIVNKKDYDNETLIKLSSRGGTSGIGIHSYFSGGFIFDLGHKNDARKKLKPSHDIKSTTLPLLLTREEMPDWSIGICIPKDIDPLNHKEERAFFDATCPLSKEAVYEASYHALFGTLAAVKTQDYDAFCSSIRNIQECDWKKAERSRHGKRLRFYEDQLYNAGADAVGMSSLGPALFFMAKDINNVIDELKDLPCQFLNAKPVNHGRIITDV